MDPLPRVGEQDVVPSDHPSCSRRMASREFALSDWYAQGAVQVVLVFRLANKFSIGHCMTIRHRTVINAPTLLAKFKGTAMTEQFRTAGGAPLKDQSGGPRTRVAQAGAICYRTSAERSTEVLLVASRRNGRWGIPKGRIETGETSGAAAAREAMEEAGVRGRISQAAIGSFIYTKDTSRLTYHLDVHLLEVRETLLDFPERQSRKLQWAPFEVAVQEIFHPSLRELLLMLPSEIQMGGFLGGSLSR